MFNRTDAGLANQHLFYNTDLVVYCEGRPTSDEGSSLDEVFWTRVFLENGKQVKCKSSGSKADLVQLSHRIIDGDLNNLAVCMDRDYDDLSENIIKDRRVIYTCGYSWENDAIVALDFDIIISLFVAIANTEPLYREYVAYFQRSSSELKRFFAIDFKYINHTEALYDRAKPLSIVEINSREFPTIRRAVILRRAANLGRFQSGELPAKTYRNACGVLRFYGKTVIQMFYHWFVTRTRGMKNSSKVPMQTFCSLVASRSRILAPETTVGNYYRAALAAI